MFQVWNSVQVKNPNHARGSKSEDPAEKTKGQAGTVFAVDPANPLEVVVKFDRDGVTEAVLVEDLLGL